MTDKTWLNAGVDAFRKATNWNPSGTPVAGDHLSIEQGEATATRYVLQGLDILLTTPRVFGGGPLPPAPVLALTDSRIAADTTIHTLGEAVQLGSPREGIIQAIGRVENDGTIIAVSQTFSEQVAQARIDLNIADVTRPSGLVQPGRFLNFGQLTAGFDSILAISSVGPQSQGQDSNAVLVNDGTITATAFGSVGIDVNLIGQGTVQLNAVPAFLPSPNTAFAGSVGIGSDVQRVGAGQDFVFDGGHLGIGSVQTRFGATLSAFTHATDQITLQDFHVVQSSFLNNRLVLRDAQGDIERLHFSGVHSLADFTVQDTQFATLITPSHPTDPI
jgi:hypothetical protein